MINKLNILTCLFEIFFIIFFFATRWNLKLLDKTNLLEKLAVLATITFIILLYFSKARKDTKRKVLLFNLNVAFLITLIVTFEILFSFFPHLLPKSLTDFAPQLSPQLSTTRINVLEYLEKSPWVKFKPNIEVNTKAITYRGDDFSHTWQTDNLGFKNKPELSQLKQYQATAIGDSSVEAMGVPTDETWASLLGDKGYPTYNLGVQGYSPQQISASLQEFGGNLNSNFIIYGYTIGFEQRALHFENYKKEKSSFTGAVEAVNQFSKESRVKQERIFKVTNAIIDFYKNMLTKNTLLHPSNKSSEEILNIYSNRMLDPIDFFDPESKAWEMTKDSIRQAKNVADQRNSEIIILLFHDREYIYYERLLQKSVPPDNYDLNVSNALKEFSKELNIDLVDTEVPLKSYIELLPNPLNVTQLPYFKIDGHLNQIGQKIITGSLTNYFQNRSSNPDQ